MITVSIEEIRAMDARIQEINSKKLEEITFTENGREINIPAEAIDSFELTGLNNTDFITSMYYLILEKMERVEKDGA